MRLKRTKLVVILAATAMALTATPSPGQEEAPEEPNILVIITDDQRAGETMAAMPKTQQWLPVDYAQAYATTPLCCPSRASIFTGRYAHNHGVTRLGGAELDHSTTIQALLGDEGYRTAFFGKYMTAYPTTDPLPEFDRYAFTGFDWRYYDATWGHNMLPSGAEVEHRVAELSGYSTSLVGRYGETFIETTDEPWLMYLAPHAPHRPYIPQHKYADAPVGPWAGNPGVFEAAPSHRIRYRAKTQNRWLTPAMTIDRLGRWIRRNGLVIRRRLRTASISIERVEVFKPNLADKPPYIRKARRLTLEQAQEIRRQQLRMLMSVDDMVDRVMRKLEENGELDNTLVVFISDNGYMWGEHGRRGKLTPYRESIQVPMRARFPGLSPKDGIVANIDIAPTALEVAGLPIPSTMDGHSLVDAGWPGRSQILTEHWCTTSPGTCFRWASVRHVSGWQYVENYDDQGQLTFREYYREDDPYQLQNAIRDGDPATTPSSETLTSLSAWIRDQGYEPVP